MGVYRSGCCDDEWFFVLFHGVFLVDVIGGLVVHRVCAVHSIPVSYAINPQKKPTKSLYCNVSIKPLKMTMPLYNHDKVNMKKNPLTNNSETTLHPQ